MKRLEQSQRPSLPSSCLLRLGAQPSMNATLAPDRPTLAAAPRPQGGQAGLQARRILVAEDNAQVRNQMREILEAEGDLLVDTVGDGKEALTALTADGRN